ncbi:hypothetical protein H8F21_14220 [Pseudomonas sp. P66]|uniref:Uncharacterized protein n=1 Tax=Pseudomonas arcuscaelestis TaxID=2710591 RepID=A0ABS2BZ49_9PSED|nr:hypothetical protein [Pseudomonas arcuscaelestis]MBM5458720.1 hypothetical protein [Pseudomonas arcuscaelestis]
MTSAPTLPTVSPQVEKSGMCACVLKQSQVDPCLDCAIADLASDDDEEIWFPAFSEADITRARHRAAAAVAKDHRSTFTATATLREVF